MSLAVACLLLLVACDTDEQQDETADESTQQPAAASDDETGEDPDDSATDAEPSHEGSADGDKVFQGTAVEYSEAMAACLEGHGLAVTLNPDDPTNFSVDAGGAQDVLFEASEACQQEVGSLTSESFPDDEVERLYEHALWQRDCLIDLGYDIPTYPSFEYFADNFYGGDEDGRLDLYRDIHVSSQEMMELQDECPGLHRWEQQQGPNN